MFELQYCSAYVVGGGDKVVVAGAVLVVGYDRIVVAAGVLLLIAVKVASASFHALLISQLPLWQSLKIHSLDFYQQYFSS